MLAESDDTEGLFSFLADIRLNFASETLNLTQVKLDECRKCVARSSFSKWKSRETGKV